MPHRADNAELISELRRLSESFERNAEMLLAAKPSNSPVFNVNAGGAGIWLATLLCATSGIFSFMTYDRQNSQEGLQAVQNLEISRKIDDHDQYLSAIYMAAPHLKPKEKDQQ